MIRTLFAFSGACEWRDPCQVWTSAGTDLCNTRCHLQHASDCT